MAERAHRHHGVAKSRGGPDEDWNFIDLDPYTHAYEHALDYVLFDHAPQFDYRHEAWPLLPEDLKTAVRKRHAERNRNFFTGRPATENQVAASKENILVAIASRSQEQNIEQGKRNGQKNVDRGVGIFAPNYGEIVSQNMKNLVSKNDHWFQTPEHSERVAKLNKEQHTCPICGEIIRGKGPLALHIKSHQNDIIKEQIKKEYIPRGKDTGYGNLSALAKKYKLNKSTILRIIKGSHEN